MNNRINATALAIALISTAMLFTACTATTPQIVTSDATAMTYDGLYPVKGISADSAWARPDVDWSSYSEIYLDDVDIEYRPGGESGRTSFSRSSGGPFEVTEPQKARLQQIVEEAFREELGGGGRFKLVDQPGPGTLLIRASLLDVVSYVPPESAASVRERVFLTRVGEATLVLEIRDSVTNTVFARAVDRRAAESVFRMQESTRITNEAEVRRLATTWARRLQIRLEEVTAS